MTRRVRCLLIASPIVGLLLLVRCSVEIVDSYSAVDAPQTILGKAFCRFERAMFDWRGPNLERSMREKIRVRTDPGTVVFDLQAVPAEWKTVCVAEFESGIANVPRGDLQWPACQGYSRNHATLFFASEAGRVLAIRTDNLDELSRRGAQASGPRPRYQIVSFGCHDRAAALVCTGSPGKEWDCALADAVIPESP